MCRELPYCGGARKKPIIQAQGQPPTALALGGGRAPARSSPAVPRQQTSADDADGRRWQRLKSQRTQRTQRTADTGERLHHGWNPREHTGRTERRRGRAKTTAVAWSLWNAACGPSRRSSHFGSAWRVASRDLQASFGTRNSDLSWSLVPGACRLAVSSPTGCNNTAQGNALGSRTGLFQQCPVGAKQTPGRPCCALTGL